MLNQIKAVHFFLVLFICIVSGSASAKGLEGLMPSNTEVRPWVVQPETRTYALVPDDFSKIYNGGYEVYTNAGAVEGLRQSYKGDGYLEVTIHKFSSVDQARAFWAAQAGKLSSYESRPVPAGMAGKMKILARGKDHIGLLVERNYYVTVSLNSSGAQVPQTVGRFLSRSSGRIRALR